MRSSSVGSNPYSFLQLPNLDWDDAVFRRKVIEIETFPCLKSCHENLLNLPALLLYNGVGFGVHGVS